MFSTDSSGDLVADRRYIMAMQLFERGDHEAALDLLAQTQELVPNWPPLSFRRGEIMVALARHADAQEQFKQYLLLDPYDHMGAVIKLTLLGAMPQPETLPPPYVEALFDDYAPRFETALVENLSYRVPQLLAQMVDRYRPCNEKTAENILDLGCGTGLAGEAFARRAAWLEGVDLSGGMIARAAAKNIYSKLSQSDILAALQQQNAHPCHLIVAADVLVYIGDMVPLFSSVAKRLTPGGLFAFSTQKTDPAEGRPYVLGADHRYAHSSAYIAECLAAAGLRLVASEEHIIRQDGGRDLTGHIVLAEAPSSATQTGFAAPLAEITEDALR